MRNHIRRGVIAITIAGAFLAGPLTTQAHAQPLLKINLIDGPSSGYAQDSAVGAALIGFMCMLHGCH